MWVFNFSSLILKPQHGHFILSDPASHPVHPAYHPFFFCLSFSFSCRPQNLCSAPPGDTIGLVYNPAFRTLSYTRNGVHLGTAAKRLAPGKQSLMIGFGEPGIKVGPWRL
eukprot:scaffold14918_cov20-Tisochrysis_lutea.AAC.5